MEQNINKITQFLSSKGAFGSQLLTISRETETNIHELRKTLEKHPLIFKKIGKTNRYAINDGEDNVDAALVPCLVAIFCNLTIVFIVIVAMKF
jgi:hypothetical protein